MVKDVPGALDLSFDNVSQVLGQIPQNFGPDLTIRVSGSGDYTIGSESLQYELGLPAICIYIYI